MENIFIKNVLVIYVKTRERIGNTPQNKVANRNLVPISLV